jgi:O-acetylserine/cysteine efflux transporter
MKRVDIVLAVFVSAIWGLAFPVIALGLESFSPPQLTALRFLIASLPIFFLPRPKLSPLSLILMGTFLFAGQFLLLFYAYNLGMPPGVAAFMQQTQVFFTVLLCAIFLRDRPTAREIVGMIVALLGIGFIASSAGSDMTLLGLGLALAGAFSWAIGNVLVKRTAGVPMLPLMAWLSVIPPLPSLAISIWFNQDSSLIHALTGAAWTSIVAAVYLGAIATTLAYAIWGKLLSRYPAAMVTPYALIAPCVGAGSSALLFGEAFSPMRYAGMALILTGVAICILRVTRPGPVVEAVGK